MKKKIFIKIVLVVFIVFFFIENWNRKVWRKIREFSSVWIFGKLTAFKAAVYS